MKPQLTRTWTGLLAALALGLAASTPAHAEIEVIVPPGSKLLTPFSAPKLPRIPGWETDLKASIARQARLLFPQGAGGDGRNALIAAQAIPKSVTEGVSTLADLIDADHLDTRSQDPGAEITEIPVVTDKAGRKIRVFAERAGNRASFRIIGYTEEKDSTGNGYWTTFTLSTGSQPAIAAAAGPFQDMLRNYR